MQLKKHLVSSLPCHILVPVLGASPLMLTKKEFGQLTEPTLTTNKTPQSMSQNDLSNRPRASHTTSRSDIELDISSRQAAIYWIGMQPILCLVIQMGSKCA